MIANDRKHQAEIYLTIYARTGRDLDRIVFQAHLKANHELLPLEQLSELEETYQVIKRYWEKMRYKGDTIKETVERIIASYRNATTVKRKKQLDDVVDQYIESLRFAQTSEDERKNLRNKYDAEKRT